MAAIFKDSAGRSPNYIACFTVYQGAIRRQLRRSTGTADRKTAMRMALELEEAGRGIRDTEEVLRFLETIEDTMVRRDARKLFDHVMRLSTGRGLGSKTARGFIDNWLTSTRQTVGQATWQKYQHTGTKFLESLGGKADHDLADIRREDIALFRDQQASRVAASTANVALKIVQIIFNAAEADGAVTRNEARHVKRLKVKADSKTRRAFTLEELNKVLKQCDKEWRSMVIVGFYTGARLGDVATFTWRNIDLEKGELSFSSRKTDRLTVVPLARPLRDHLEKMAGDDPRAPLHPRACEAIRNGKGAMLSRQFADLLAAAGLAAARTHEADETKHGRAGRRSVSELSFHALRHTNVSLLKNAGVSDAVARDIAGHDSVEVSRQYTHIEHKTKLEALNRLPVLGRM